MALDLGASTYPNGFVYILGEAKDQIEDEPESSRLKESFGLWS